MEDGALIRSTREAAGLTQAQLATRLGTTQSSVARWERGATSPTLATLRRILSACGCDLEWSAPVWKPADPGIDRTVMRELLRLSPRQRLERAGAETVNLEGFPIGIGWEQHA
ncbi:MAG: transcriptional regulator, family [Acidimicrobiales bacterium]|nr:transcriptional regulator, family [Acidimicrobiales bacterium]